MKKTLRGAVFIIYLIKKIKEKYPKKQITKTSIQKLMYLFEVLSKKDFNYTMYHYGPHSFQIDTCTEIAQKLGGIDILWYTNKGYIVELKNNDQLNKLLNKLRISEKETKILDHVAKKYGAYSTEELTIIATATYAKENFKITDTKELINAVSSLKPENKKEQIQNLLLKMKARK